MATVTLWISPQRAHVRTARLVAAAMARRSGVQEDLLDEIRLAVGEACARAVRLHERHSVQEPVVVELSDGHSFEVVVRDVAPASESTPSVDWGAVLASPSSPTPPALDVSRRPPGPAVRDDPVPGGAGLGGGGGLEVGGADAEDVAETAAADGETADHVSGQQPAAGIGLALLDALVDSIVIEPADPGTRVRMCWPIA